MLNLGCRTRYLTISKFRFLSSQPIMTSPPSLIPPLLVVLVFVFFSFFVLNFSTLIMMMFPTLDVSFCFFSWPPLPFEVLLLPETFSLFPFPLKTEFALSFVR